MLTATRPRFAPTTTQPTPWHQHAVLGALIALALTMFVVQGFCVSGACMEPHLFTGERVLAWKMAYAASEPKRGDIVIFHYPRDPRQIYVKRIVALPGETVSMHGGQMHVNDHLLPELYKVRAAHGDMTARRVPRGQYFVMGDNRDVSDDSRYWGSLPQGQIIGRAVVCYWPPLDAHILR